MGGIERHSLNWDGRRFLSSKNRDHLLVMYMVKLFTASFVRVYYVSDA